MPAKEEAKRLLDWIGPDPLNPDKLHPELKKCYSADGSWGPMIKHPLVNEIMFHSWKIANEMYEAKRKRIAEHIEKGEYGNALWFYERPWRLTTFYDWWKSGEITIEQMRELLPHVWTDCEFPLQFGQKPLRLFNAAGFITDIEDKDHIEAFLPAKSAITVYRGCGRPGYRDGISWTKSPERADWFAGRFNKGNKYIYAGEATPNTILGIFLGRGEEEVVVSPRRLKNLRRV